MKNMRIFFVSQIIISSIHNEYLTNNWSMLIPIRAYKMDIVRFIFMTSLMAVYINATFMGMSSCGCGGGSGFGRKKRDLLGQQIRTESDSPCPQSEWKPIIEENIRDDPESTKFAVQGAMFRHFEEKFFVACVDKAKQNLLERFQFVSNGEAYCNHGNDKMWCQVLALYG
uniref:Ground-like domain-containing protein n=1 Tax=Acrobeloides nanus TaxID=290746 RepID=A0A914CNC2_9BILA